MLLLGKQLSAHYVNRKEAWCCGSALLWALLYRTGDTPGGGPASGCEDTVVFRGGHLCDRRVGVGGQVLVQDVVRNAEQPLGRHLHSSMRAQGAQPAKGRACRSSSSVGGMPWSRKDRCDHDGYHETTLPFQQCVPVSACRLPM